MSINNIIKIFILSILTLSYLNAAGMMGDTGMKNKKRVPPKGYKEDISFDNISYKSSNKPKKEFIISSVEDEEFAYIDVGGLKIGESGIIVNKKNKPIIIAIASVVESSDKRSKLLLSKYDDLKQDAIPTSNLNVAKGDTLILDYLYEASTIIAPNSESFHVVRNMFKDYNFIHSDLLASFLKVEEKPIPFKEVIQKFLIQQNLGSLVIIIKQKAYFIDARTFKVIDVKNIKYEDKEEMKPFYTRVEDIEPSVFNMGEETIGDYTKYYKKLLDIK